MEPALATQLAIAPIIANVYRNYPRKLPALEDVFGVTGFLLTLCILGIQSTILITMVWMSVFLVAHIAHALNGNPQFAAFSSSLVFVTVYRSMTNYPPGHNAETILLVGVLRCSMYFDLIKPFNPLKYIRYMYACYGVLVGPVLPPESYTQCEQSLRVRKALPWRFIFRRILQTSFHLVVFLFGTNSFTVLFHEGLEWAWPRRFMHMYLYTLWYRSRLMVAWLACEIAFAVVGFGCQVYEKSGPDAHPHVEGSEARTEASEGGREELIEKYEILKNYDTLHVETATELKTLMRTWNKSCQRALHKSAYLNLGILPRALRQITTYTVSALWHGTDIHFFCTAGMLAISLPVQLAFVKDRWLPGPLDRLLKMVVCQFLLTFMMVPFVTRSYHQAVAIWAHTWYVEVWIFLALAGIVLLRYSFKK